MSSENKLANKKRRSQKIAFGILPLQAIGRILFVILAFIVTRVELLAGNSLALCQKME
jgi:hypothetical protein